MVVRLPGCARSGPACSCSGCCRWWRAWRSGPAGAALPAVHRGAGRAGRGSGRARLRPHRRPIRLLHRGLGLSRLSPPDEARGAARPGRRHRSGAGAPGRGRGRIWQAGAGSLAYAYPTYEGTGPKTDLPAAERDRIAAVNQQAARDEQPIDRGAGANARRRCCCTPARSAGPIPGLTAWTMTRCGRRRATSGCSSAWACSRADAGMSGGWPGWQCAGRGSTCAASRRRCGGTALEDLPRWRTGERELDRIVDALNNAGRGWPQARQEPKRWPARVARAERLAGAGPRGRRAWRTKSATRSPPCACRARTRSPATTRAGARPSRDDARADRPARRAGRRTAGDDAARGRRAPAPWICPRSSPTSVRASRRGRRAHGSRH